MYFQETKIMKDRKRNFQRFPFLRNVQSHKSRELLRFHLTKTTFLLWACYWLIIIQLFSHGKHDCAVCKKLTPCFNYEIWQDQSMNCFQTDRKGTESFSSALQLIGTQRSWGSFHGMQPPARWSWAQTHSNTKLCTWFTRKVRLHLSSSTS